MAEQQKKMGRPRKEIDWRAFDKLCRWQCTLEEISDWFDCSEDTIERAVTREKDTSFADYFKKKSAAGKCSLRRAQFKNAIKGGSVPMQIWLGKQYLGQRETVTQEHSGHVASTTTIDLAKLTDDQLADLERIVSNHRHNGNGSPIAGRN